LTALHIVGQTFVIGLSCCTQMAVTFNSLVDTMKAQGGRKKSIDTYHRNLRPKSARSHLCNNASAVFMLLKLTDLRSYIDISEVLTKR